MEIFVLVVAMMIAAAYSSHAANEAQRQQEAHNKEIADRYEKEAKDAAEGKLLDEAEAARLRAARKKKAASEVNTRRTAVALQQDAPERQDLQVISAPGQKVDVGGENVQ